MCSSSGIVGKLIAAGVVAKRQDEFYFTDEFFDHLVSSNPEQYIKAGQLKGWRVILSYFNPALLSLSEVEISKTVALFDYFRRNLGRDKTPLVHKGNQRHPMN